MRIVSLGPVNDNREVATMFSQVRCDDVVVKLDRWLEHIYPVNQFNNNRTSAWTSMFRAYHLSSPLCANISDTTPLHNLGYNIEQRSVKR